MINEKDILAHQKSEEEHKYTSTGIKFWRHKEAMTSYRSGDGRSVISTHISPNGSCNLKCPYCSVSKRKVTERIDFGTIKDYVTKLKSRGLKAVIITGGGEPTLYPEFNELVRWLKRDMNLSVALITNGTNIDKVDKDVWDMFSWVRISINFFKDYEKRIRFPDIKGVLGCSLVYVGQDISEFKKVSKMIDAGNVKYVRVLPNCLLPQNELVKQHVKIEEVLTELGDNRFFHQFKMHGTPTCATCHQAYFRPYLSEVGGGTVFPCDSLVLNNKLEHFGEQYAICKAEEVLDFLDRRINLKFDASKSCTGCVFTDNLALLDDWVENEISKFEEFGEKMIHEEFV